MLKYNQWALQITTIGLERCGTQSSKVVLCTVLHDKISDQKPQVRPHLVFLRRIAKSVAYLQILYHIFKFHLIIIISRFIILFNSQKIILKDKNWHAQLWEPPKYKDFVILRGTYKTSLSCYIDGVHIYHIIFLNHTCPVFNNPLTFGSCANVISNYLFI